MWKAEWATLGGSADFVKELAHRVKREDFRRRIAIAIEFIGAACTSTFGVWFAVDTKGDLPAVVLCGGMFLFNGIWLTRMLTGFRRADPSASDVAAFVKLTRGRHRDLIRWIRFARWSTLVTGIACYAWILWIVRRAGATFSDPETLIPIAVVAVILAGLFVWYYVARKIIDRRLARFEALVAERTME